jgi:hypothetical protein
VPRPPTPMRWLGGSKGAKISGFSSYKTRTEQGAHLWDSLVVAATSTQHTMARLRPTSSAMVRGGSKGWIKLELGQTGVVQRPQAQSGVTVGQKSVKRWRGEHGDELGFYHS